MGGEDVSEVALGGSCTLFSFTIVHMKTAHFDPPYAIGYVDFPEGVRVFGPIQTDDLASLKVGMPLSVRIGPLWHAADGTAIVAHCFVPIVGN
ncbi:putative OB-fold protein [Bradyrhizobium diazoefficiens]